MHLDAASLHLGEGVLTANDHAADTFSYYKLGAGRGLAVVGTWLQAHVDGGVGQQRLVVGAHRGKRIDLGMALAAACMIAFADDSSVARAERRLLWGCCYALPSLGEGLWVGC